MNNNKEPEKIEFKNNKRDTGKIVTIVFFTLAVLILLITLLLVYTPLKDLLFKKSIAEETIEELTEETTKKTNEKEVTEKTTEETTQETTEEPTEEETTIPENGKWTFIDTREAKHQGIVKDIDYENKIITIENANTGETEKLNGLRETMPFTYTKLIDGVVHTKRGRFEDIKVGYYITVATRGDFVPDAEEPDFIFGIKYSEKRWW